MCLGRWWAGTSGFQGTSGFHLHPAIGVYSEHAGVVVLVLRLPSSVLISERTAKLEFGVRGSGSGSGQRIRVKG